MLSKKKQGASVSSATGVSPWKKLFLAGIAVGMTHWMTSQVHAQGCDSPGCRCQQGQKAQQNESKGSRILQYHCATQQGCHPQAPAMRHSKTRLVRCRSMQQRRDTLFTAAASQNSSQVLHRARSTILTPGFLKGLRRRACSQGGQADRRLNMCVQ